MFKILRNYLSENTWESKNVLVHPNPNNKDKSKLSLYSNMPLKFVNFAKQAEKLVLKRVKFLMYFFVTDYCFFTYNVRKMKK